MTEHKHAAVLRAIADGREVEYRDIDKWITTYGAGTMHTNPLTRPEYEWRIKPEPRTPRRIWVAECELLHTTTIMCSRQPFNNGIEFVEVLPDE